MASSAFKFNSCKLTPEQVLTCLTRNELTGRQLADMLNVSPSTIQKIRKNQSYAHLHPEVPRLHAPAQGPRCFGCVHHLHDSCSLDFPEFRRRGILTAPNCGAYATESLAA